MIKQITNKNLETVLNGRQFRKNLREVVEINLKTGWHHGFNVYLAVKNKQLIYPPLPERAVNPELYFEEEDYVVAEYIQDRGYCPFTGETFSLVDLHVHSEGASIMPSEEDLKYLRTITRDEKESTKLDVKPIMAIAQPVSRGKQVDVLLMQYLGSYHNPLNVEQVDNILATEYERGPSNEEIAELINNFHNFNATLLKYDFIPKRGYVLQPTNLNKFSFPFTPIPDLLKDFCD